MSFTVFMSEYGMKIISYVIMAVLGYAGVVAKNLFKKFVNTKLKRDIVYTCANAVEQMYKQLHGEEKLTKCIEASTAMLAEKGIAISELEVRMLIESAVGEFSKNFESTE